MVPNSQACLLGYWILLLSNKSGFWPQVHYNGGMGFGQTWRPLLCPELLSLVPSLGHEQKVVLGFQNLFVTNPGAGSHGEDERDTGLGVKGWEKDALHASEGIRNKDEGEINAFSLDIV